MRTISLLAASAALAWTVGAVPVCRADGAGGPDDQPHFHFAGPMSAFMAEGATPGAVTSGLPFTIELAEGGAKVTPASFDLKGPKWQGAATLALDGPKFADGHLTGTLRLRNGSGSVIEGVRLDVTGATEEYRAKDEQGKDVLKTRPMPAAIASPLLFGDVPKDEDADPEPLDVIGIAFKPETTRILVHGLLSGLYYVGSFTDGTEHCVAVQLDTDPKGRVYLADRNEDTIYRTDADGSSPQAVAKLPAAVRGVAVDPKTGGIVGTYINAHDFLLFTPGGDDAGKIEQDDGAGVFVGWPGWARYDRMGTLYVGFGKAIHRLAGGKPVMSVSSVGNYEFQGGPAFDIAPDGALWVATGDTLFRVDASGKSGKRAAIGPDWRLGKVTSPQAVRVDAQGNVYVLEGETNVEWTRASVFDRNGHVVRVFGHGNKTPKENNADAWPGELRRNNYDLAFGPDGTVYVAVEDTHDSVLMFQPF